MTDLNWKNYLLSHNLMDFGIVVCALAEFFVAAEDAEALSMLKVLPACSDGRFADTPSPSLLETPTKGRGGSSRMTELSPMLKVLRMFRLLRAVRAIQHVEKLRVICATVLGSMVAVAGALVLVLIIYICFG